jgi:hypothetical protein
MIPERNNQLRSLATGGAGFIGSHPANKESRLRRSSMSFYPGGRIWDAGANGGHYTRLRRCALTLSRSAASHQRPGGSFPCLRTSNPHALAGPTSPEGQPCLKAGKGRR